jgi:hypothetical protein
VDVGRYLRWVRQYILFYGKRPPAEPGAKDVGTFVFTREEARAVLSYLREEPWLRPLSLPLYLVSSF